MLECSYCCEFRGDREGSYYLRNIEPQIGGGRIRLESKIFYIYPSIGSLVPGHLLIVPKRHCTALSLLDTEELIELSEILEDIGKLNSVLFESQPNHFAFEHGILDLNKSMMTCVDHAHLHILPVSINHKLLKLSTAIPVKLSELNTIKFHDPDYILYGDLNNHFVDCGRDKHPQYLRKMIHENLQLTGNWNWRTDSQVTNIANWLNKFDEFTKNRKLESIGLIHLKHSR